MNPVFFTIVTASYLPRARVLAESVLRQHAGAEFYVVLADQRADDHAAYAAQAGIKLVYLDELSLPAPQRFLFRYGVLELCTAIKPYGFAWLFAHAGAQQVIYLDPDIYVLAPLAPVLDAFADGAMAVLTPHLTAPLEEDGKRPDERNILQSGAYNLGFLGLARRGDCDALLAWWSRRLEHHALVDPVAGLFTDQKWMDLVPGMFGQVRVLRETGLNLAYWNLMQRRVEHAQGRWLVDGAPLVFVHFSGIDPRRPAIFSANQDRYTRADCGAIGPLYDEYLARMEAAGDPQWRTRPYAWGRLADGTPIVPAMRAVFRRLWDEERGPGLAPFELTAAAFNARSSCVQQFAPLCITHVMYELWATDAGLHSAHELSTAAGRAAYARWFAARANATFGVPPALVPQGEAAVEAAALGRESLAPRVRRWAYHAAHEAYLSAPPPLKRLIRRHRPQALRDYVRRSVVPVLQTHQYHVPAPVTAAAGQPAVPGGATLVGYLGYALGTGRPGARWRACGAAGVPFDIYDLPFAQRHPDSEGLPSRYPMGAQPRETLILCVNADGMANLPGHLRRAALPDRYRIANWYWELEHFPDTWLSAFHEVDELWAGSPFVQAALAAVSPVPVLYVPPPVEFSLSRAYGRGEFGLPPTPCLFLFSYDFDSFVARKNPQACIAAFQEAFPPQRADVALAIKMLHAERHPQALAALRELARADPRIHLLDMALSRDAAYGLISVCDVYVSLHRAEGFGLGMAEAMYLGKPVVATGYSGNLAFMQADNSCLVQYRMVPVGEAQYLHGEGQQWAEPDIAHAARLMRGLADDRALREHIGGRAARHMAARFSLAQVGEMIRRRLRLIAARRAAGP